MVVGLPCLALLCFALLCLSLVCFLSVGRSGEGRQQQLQMWVVETRVRTSLSFSLSLCLSISLWAILREGRTSKGSEKRKAKRKLAEEVKARSCLWSPSWDSGMAHSCERSEERVSKEGRCFTPFFLLFLSSLFLWWSSALSSSFLLLLVL